ncbi:MAG: L-fucose:H+ symporter permease [Prevotellaceae bacterium]|jgi:FHS family L-fucose permease-like MFS transporter|nr:L-fucose:H+ symporter permease [Prevotellaceae bacterium]
MNLRSDSTQFKGKNGENYLFPFILITCLFFLWGFAHSLLDVLNKHFQDSLDLTKAQSGAIQAAAYGAYFVMAIPAGLIAGRFGYKAGIIVGLALFAAGAFGFVPAVGINTFGAFLLALLILFAGLTFLETVANPYAIVLGTPERAASRINLAQTFNAVGWILGPLIGSVLIFGNEAETSGNAALILPYAGLGVVVLVVLALFFFVRLPEIKPEENDPTDTDTAGAALLSSRPLIKQRRFVFAVVAQLLYVAAQTGVGSFFINYAIEVDSLQLTEMQAGLLLGLGGMALFAVGRLSGSFLMKRVKPGVLLGICALVNTLLMAVIIASHNRVGVLSLMLCYLFMSIMFPSIFALGVKGLGEKTKKASSILVLTVVGGAIAPSLMGWIGATHMNLGFIIPLACFGYIAFFGFAESRQ